MKNFYKSLLAVATLAMAFTSCSKDEVSESPSEPRKVVITVTTDGELEKSPASRTEYDEATNQMNWSATGEALEVIELINNTFTHATTTSYTLTGRVANFQVAFTENTTAESFIYSAVYPATSFADQKSGNTDCYRVNLPNEQTPSLTSFDANADLLVSMPVTKTLQPSEGGEALQFRFQRIASVGKMTLKGITAGEKIAKVEFTPSQGKTLAGYTLVDLKTGAVSEIGYFSRGALVLNLGDREATGEDVVWFTTLPVTFAEGDSFTVKVTTDKATYEKTAASFTAEKPLVFASGGVTKFGIKDMTRTENMVDEYVLLTNVADLAEGDQIIIASAGTAGAAKAISTTQNSNNRKATDVTIVDGPKITDIATDIQILEVQTGTAENSFAFYTGEAGYLYAASSTSNHLKTQTTLDANGSWVITVTPDGKATIIGQGDMTRNSLRYNTSSSIFSCYASGQADVYIYRKAAAPSTDPFIKSANLNVDAAAITNGTSTYSIGNTTKTAVTVTCDGTVVTVAMADNGEIMYEVSGNYGTEVREGWIELALTNDATVTKRIIVTQAGSTFTVPESVSIANDATTATFNVVSSDFGWTITAPEGITVNPITGNAGETEVTVTSNTANSGTETLPLGSLSILRTDDVAANAKSITVNKLAAGQSAEKVVDIEFSTLGYTNQQEVSTYTSEDVTISFDKGTNSNTPKYFTSGEAVRVYGGGTITVSTTLGVISKIEISGYKDKADNNLSSNTGTIANTNEAGTKETEISWNGSANNIIFTVNASNGHFRIKTVKVTYE